MTGDNARAFQVRRNDERSRYEAFLGADRIGFADFHEVGRAVVLPHVEIDSRHEGNGYASGLTRLMLDDLRSRGVTSVVPQCPYVQAWLAKHPPYQDLSGS